MTTLDLRDLRDDRTYGSARRRHHHLFAILQRANFQQPAIGRDTRAAERVHVDRQRQIRITLQRDQRLAVSHVDLAEANALPHELAFLEIRVPRFNHPPNAAAQQRSIERLIRIQPRPHVGIDRHDQRLDTNLALARRRHICFDNGKVRQHGNAAGTTDKMDLAGLCHWRSTQLERFS